MFSTSRILILFSLVVLANSMPHNALNHRAILANRAQSDLHVQNLKVAQTLNAKFKTLSADSSCTEGETACVGKDFAICDQGKYVQMSCGPSMQCYALPLINSVGTTVTCDTEADAGVRLGGQAGSGGSSGPLTTVATSTEAPSTTSAPQTPPPPPPPSTTTSSQPTSTGNAGGGLSVLHGTQTGQGTWYETGLTACGIQNTDEQAIVAVSHILFDEYPGYTGGNPNNNPICNKQIRATYQGKTVTATITDRCEACAETDIDFTPSLFKELTNGDLGIGRLFGLTWEWV